MPVEILPLTPDRLPDLAALFEQGGDPKWCWCAYFRVRGRDWTNSTARREPRRADARRRRGRDRGPCPGLVAYVDGAAVGWVSVGPREDYERLVFSKILAPVDDRPVWSIVCFVVGRAVSRPGRRPRAARGGRRLCAGPRSDTRRGVPRGRRTRGTDRLGERLPRHARDVPNGRLRGGRPPSGARGDPRPADRPPRTLGTDRRPGPRRSRSPIPRAASQDHSVQFWARVLPPRLQPTFGEPSEAAHAPFGRQEMHFAANLGGRHAPSLRPGRRGRSRPLVGHVAANGAPGQARVGPGPWSHGWVRWWRPGSGPRRGRFRGTGHAVSRLRHPARVDTPVDRTPRLPTGVQVARPRLAHLEAVSE